MLSGEILNGSALSVALFPSPPTTAFVEFVKTMAALAALTNQQNIDDDDNVFLGNKIYKAAHKKKQETIQAFCCYTQL